MGDARIETSGRPTKGLDRPIKVLDHPISGFLEVDEASVVVSIAPNVPVKQIVSDISTPAMILWNVPGSIPERGDPENESWTDEERVTWETTGHPLKGLPTLRYMLA